MKHNLILITENDEEAAGRVVSILEEAGNEVVRAADTFGGLAMLYEAHPDPLIMASYLPVFSGDNPCRGIIRQASYMSIIVLGGIYDAIEALEMGADAYMTRPPGREELVARVNALLCRRKSNSDISVSGPHYESCYGHTS